jgi:Cu+-exporting ATPase
VPAAPAAAPTAARVVLPVTGMTCAACQARVQRTLARTPGVRDATVNFLLHSAAITYDPGAVTAEALVERVRATGYGADLPGAPSAHGTAGTTAASAAPADAPGARDRAEYRAVRRRALVALGAGAVAMVASMPLMAAGAHAAGAPAGGAHGADPFLRWAMTALDPALARVAPWLYAIPPRTLAVGLFALTTAVMAWAGGAFYRRAWQALRHHSADMNTLVAVGTGAAYVYSAAAVLAPGWFVRHGVTPDVYFEAVVLILGFVLAGRALEARAKARTADAPRRARRAPARRGASPPPRTRRRRRGGCGRARRRPRARRRGARSPRRAPAGGRRGRRRRERRRRKRAHRRARAGREAPG